MRSPSLTALYSAILFAPIAAMADPPDSYEFYPGSPLILGANFDPNRITAAKTPCMRYTADSQPQGAVNTTFTELLTTSSRTLRTALGIDTSIDVQYLTFKGSASFSYNQSNYTHSENVSFVMRAYTEYGTRNIITADVLPDYKPLLATPNEFVKTCGSRYVKIERRGASVAAIITLENVDSDFKRDFTAEASLSGGIGPVSASFKSKLKTQMDSAATDGRLSVDVLSTGGDGFGGLKDVIAKSTAKSPGAFDAIVNALSSYIERFNKDNAAPLAFTVADIPGLSQAQADLWPIQKERAIEALVSEYRDFSGHLAAINAIVSDEDPRSTVISIEKKAELQAAIPKFELYLQHLADIHGRCKASATAEIGPCALPTDRPDPEIVPSPLLAPSGGFRLIEGSGTYWPGTYWSVAQSAGVFAQPDTGSTTLQTRAARIERSVGGALGIGFAIPDPYFVDATIVYRLDTILDSTGKSVSIGKEYGGYEHFSREDFSNFNTTHDAKNQSLHGPNGDIPVIAFELVNSHPSNATESSDYVSLVTTVPLAFLGTRSAATALAVEEFKSGARSGFGQTLIRLRNITGVSKDYSVGPFSWVIVDSDDSQTKTIVVSDSLPGLTETNSIIQAFCTDSQIATIKGQCVPKTCPDGQPSSFIMGCLRP